MHQQTEYEDTHLVTSHFSEKLEEFLITGYIDRFPSEVYGGHEVTTVYAKFNHGELQPNSDFVERYWWLEFNR